MSVTSVHDRELLAQLLSLDPALHAYELGDLDDFYWPYTTWYRLGEAVALIYHGGLTPTLLCLEHSPRLLSGLIPLLPQRFYAHLYPGGEQELAAHFENDTNGPHYKMALTNRRVFANALAAVELPGKVLTESDVDDALELYAESYPGNWFDPRMLQTGHYVGIRRDGKLLAIAGIHVWAPGYGVSALGNVATHPSARGQGLATAAVARLCEKLLSTVDTITLNVKADNASAVGLYSRLGFTRMADYHEHTFSARQRIVD